MLSLHRCVWDFSGCGKRGLLPIAVLRLLLFQSMGSGVVAHGLSCSSTCGIFPNWGMNLCLQLWQMDSQPLAHLGSPSPSFFQSPANPSRVSCPPRGSFKALEPFLSNHILSFFFLTFFKMDLFQKGSKEFFFFLLHHSLWDLCSPTRDQVLNLDTPAPSSESMES